ARPAAKFDVTEKMPLSVATGRDLETIARERDAVWESKVVDKPARGGKWRPKTAARKATAVGPAEVRCARKGPLPRTLRPQLATLVTEAPAGHGWPPELKSDAYRLLGRVQDGRARLVRRNAHDWTATL